MTPHNERLTAGITTLDYYIRWISLHPAHIIGCKEHAATSFWQTLVAIARLKCERRLS